MRSQKSVELFFVYENHNFSLTVLIICSRVQRKFLCFETNFDSAYRQKCVYSSGRKKHSNEHKHNKEIREKLEITGISTIRKHYQL
jgi:hypothetical protein